MASENTSKLNQLLTSWPAGTIALLPWLQENGISQQLAHEYEKSSWLTKLGRGAYIRLSDKVNWSGAVYAIQQQLSLPIHLGGKSALELKGLAHFIRRSEGGYLYLFGPHNIKPPSWFMHHDWGNQISYKTSQLFEGELDLGFTSHSFGTYEIRISTPERAILELINLSPREQSIEEANLLLEGLGNLRLGVLQELLSKCQSVKTKRLFLALAEQHNHAWFKKLDLSLIDLGSGKRVLVKEGVLNTKYQITLPKEIASQKDEK